MARRVSKPEPTDDFRLWKEFYKHFGGRLDVALAAYVYCEPPPAPHGYDSRWGAYIMDGTWVMDLVARDDERELVARYEVLLDEYRQRGVPVGHVASTSDVIVGLDVPPDLAAPCWQDSPDAPTRIALMSRETNSKLPRAKPVQCPTDSTYDFRMSRFQGAIMSMRDDVADSPATASLHRDLCAWAARQSQRKYDAAQARMLFRVLAEATQPFATRAVAREIPWVAQLCDLMNLRPAFDNSNQPYRNYDERLRNFMTSLLVRTMDGYTSFVDPDHALAVMAIVFEHVRTICLKALAVLQGWDGPPHPAAILDTEMRCARKPDWANAWAGLFGRAESETTWRMDFTNPCQISIARI